MKKIMKKTLCLLSSTVLLCGLTALPAGAKSLDPENSVKLEPELKTLKGHTFNPYRNTEFVLKQNKFNIKLGEKAVLEVGKEYKLIDEAYSGPQLDKIILSMDKIDLLRLRFQWYDENGPIEGATSYTYNAYTPGKYFCVVTMIGHLWITDTAAVNVRILPPILDPVFRHEPTIPSKPGPLPI